jgi:hypothetical protein
MESWYLPSIDGGLMGVYWDKKLTKTVILMDITIW